MNFLCPYIIKVEETLTNVPPLGADDEEQTMSPASIPDAQVIQRSSASHIAKRMKTEYSTHATPIHSLFQSYQERKYKDRSRNESDTIVDFFTNLGQTVITFPEDVQICVKSAVFKIVNDAEAEIVQNKRGGHSQ